MLDFTPTAGSLAESQTLAISATAKRMRAEGIKVAPFAAGEPDFDTPDYIKAAGIAAIQEGRTKYAPAAGIMPLREAVAQNLNATSLPELKPTETIVSIGAKGVLYLALRVLVREGDEVILPAPAWLSYPKMVQSCGGTSVFVPTAPGDGYVIDPDRVRAAVTPNTRVLLLNSPGNPTGALQPDDVQAELGRIAVEHDIAVISDEIYEHLVYAPATFRSFGALAPEARDRTLIVNGVSKAFAMTGWRIGYAGGPAEWIQRMVRLQSHAFSGPPEIAQRAALAALKGPVEEIAKMCEVFRRRRDVMHEGLASIPDLHGTVPDGAFYMLPDVSPYFGRSFRGEVVKDATQLSALMLEHAHAAVVPGDVFEAPFAIRFSYACSRADIEDGLAGVKSFLAEFE